MTALQGHGLQLAVGLVCASLAVLVLVACLPSPGGSAAVATGHTPAATDGPIRNFTDPPSHLPTVVATVGVGTEPVAGAVDPATGLAYVTNTISNNVSILNGTAVVATVDVALNETASPVAAAYDPVNGYVYVVDRYDFESQGGAVSVLNGTSVRATIAVGDLPTAAVVDPATGYVYVTNSGSGNVSVLDGVGVLGSVPVGTGPVAGAYDPEDGYVYVANEGSSNVSALFGNALVDTLAAGTGPGSVAYDGADGFVYVANNVSNNVTVFDDLAVVGNVPVGADPTFVAYNPSVGAVEAANSNSSNVSLVNGTTNVGSLGTAAGPAWVGVDPTGAFTLVVGAGANEVTVDFGTSFLTNLPVGSVPTFALVDPLTQLTYVTNSGSNTVSVIALGFPVTFNETGLAASVPWSVTFDGSLNTSTGASIGFVAANGTYPYTVGVPTGYRLVGATPSSPLTVDNASVTVLVTFAALPHENYTLTFVETGLSSCQGMGGNSGGHQPAGASGSCCMSQGPPAWSVTVGNVTRSTTNTSVAFSEPSGTYTYSVDAPSGYVVNLTVPASPVTITDANVTVNVTFQAANASRPVSITFEEDGLPKGTTWCVTLNTTVCSSGRSIVFTDLSPGSYGFNVSAVSGYTAHPSSGSVRLSHRSVTVTVKFTASRGSGGGCGGSGGY